jgi:hypothetical protein
VKSIAEALASIPLKADRFPHLAELSTDAMLLRRVEIAEQLKRLEEERQAGCHASVVVPFLSRRRDSFGVAVASLFRDGSSGVLIIWPFE